MAPLRTRRQPAALTPAAGVEAGDVEMPEIESGGNVIEAAANGITDGLKLAVNVGAMLIGFIALIAVVDVILRFLDGLILALVFGTAFSAIIRTGSSTARATMSLPTASSPSRSSSLMD